MYHTSRLRRKIHGILQDHRHKLLNGVRARFGLEHNRAACFMRRNVVVRKHTQKVPHGRAISLEMSKLTNTIIPSAQ